MRASAISVEHAIGEQQAVRTILDTNDLKASMVMGNVPLAANNAEAPDCLRNITPHLDLAERLGAALVRIMLQSEADIPHAQRAADEAAERGITLAQQTHWGTLCETVEESLDVVRRMDRQNFGIRSRAAAHLQIKVRLTPQMTRDDTSLTLHGCVAHWSCRACV